MNYEILDRIEERLAKLDMTPNHASVAAGGSGDLIRNWQRARQAGRPFPGKAANLAAIAPVLGVTTEWLLGEDRAFELADEVTPYVAKPVEPGATLGAILAPGVTQRLIFHADAAVPSLGIIKGDVLVVDMKNAPRLGDTVIAAILDGDWTRKRILRYLPPYLVSGDPHEAPIELSIARIQGPIVALARGPGL